MSTYQERIDTILSGNFTLQDFILIEDDSTADILLDAKTGEKIREISTTKNFHCKRYIPSSGLLEDPLLVYQSRSSSTIISSLITGKIEFELNKRVTCMAVISSSLMAFGFIEIGENRKGYLEIWDIRRNKLIGNKITFPSFLIRILPLGSEELVIAFNDKSVVKRNYKTGDTFSYDIKPLLPQIGYSFIEGICKFSEDKILILSSGTSGMFNIQTGELLKTFDYSRVNRLNDNELIFLKKGRLNYELYLTDNNLEIKDNLVMYNHRIAVLPENRFVISYNVYQPIQNKCLYLFKVADGKMKAEKQFGKFSDVLIYIPALPLDVRILKNLLRIKMRDCVPKVLVDEVFSFFA